jgi:hypothetical protein
MELQDTQSSVYMYSITENHDQFTIIRLHPENLRNRTRCFCKLVILNSVQRILVYPGCPTDTKRTFYLYLLVDFFCWHCTIVTVSTVIYLLQFSYLFIAVFFLQTPKLDVFLHNTPKHPTSKLGMKCMQYRMRWRSFSGRCCSIV